MRSYKLFKSILTIAIFFIVVTLSAQEAREIVDYRNREEYTIAGITTSGVRYLDSNALIGLSGLRIGQIVNIPGDEITSAVKKLWSQGLFSDVRITVLRTEGLNAYLDIYLQERPRLSTIKFEGIKNSEAQDLLEKVNIPNGSQVTSHVISTAKSKILEHYIDKGFLNTEVTVIEKDDPDSQNNVILTLNVDKKDKVKIEEITFVGAENFKEKRLRRVMKDTKQKDLNFFKPSKYIAQKFDDDKIKLSEFYNENGYRDFEIMEDSLYKISEDRIGLAIRINEGSQYYLRSVDWVGNSVYTKEQLSRQLKIEPGTVYNQTLINDRLTLEEDAVNSLYLDNGYLFSQVVPVESKIDGDSIDLQVRIFEGDQAYLNNVILAGNTRTNEHVARRELYTMPGDLFSKTNIIRSVRQVAVLGHFDPEKINPQPLPDMANGTVDLLYVLEEKANDQFEVSGGWGAGMLVGTVGVRFNNFAMRNVFDAKAWRPYPSGDGQSLSIRAQSNGRIYQSYNISFVEPWLGGKKPNTFSVSLYRSLMTNGQKKTEDSRQSMIINGASIGFGKRLEWPDDYFSLFTELSYQRYDLYNYEQFRFLFKNGVSNLFSLTTRLTRFSSGPNPIYPMRGSTFTLSLQATPPYSLISGKDFTDAIDTEKYKWIEFHKWTFKGDYYFNLVNKLVINPKVAFGYLGLYNKDIGPSPFENFQLGGDGMTGYSFYGREVIALRGYENGSLTPNNAAGIPSGNLYTKLTFEVRYPISLNPQATIFGLVFLEAGKAWYELKEFNPFKLNRSAGFGLRANLPMFGLLGIDWGYGFDPVPGRPSANKGQFHFVIGQQF
ncbi:MAG: outer membrane protein assembly factor BamA [Bacteroidales bacterium]|nr:outer membrane protein assembly factor BamA [Bacteroidales bacterium]